MDGRDDEGEPFGPQGIFIPESFVSVEIFLASMGMVDSANIGGPLYFGDAQAPVSLESIDWDMVRRLHQERSVVSKKPSAGPVFPQWGSGVSGLGPEIDAEIAAAGGDALVDGAGDVATGREGLSREDLDFLSKVGRE